MTKTIKDPLGDRMKKSEIQFRDYIGDHIGLPIYLYMRIDGRSFSNFTKKLASRGLLLKPRDVTFESIFIYAVRDTVSEFNLKLGFHQSDEISLFFAPVIDPESQLLFDGNIQKLTSVVSSYFTARFCYHFNEQYHEVPECSFDARVAAFNDPAEATNMLVWRYQDARRNMIQDIAYHQFGAKKLHKVSTNEKFEMIGSPELRPGNFIKRVQYMLPVDTGGKVNIAPEVKRSRTDQIFVDFANLDFDARVDLIYGKMIVPA